MTLNIGIAGATGLVGDTIRQVLEDSDLPIDRIRFLASERSQGQTLSFRSRDFEVELLGEDSFAGLDYVFFAIGDDLSRYYARFAMEAGAVVIDNSNAFRMEEGVPLVVAELNADQVGKDDYLIANPNCSTIQSVLALAPLYNTYGIKRVVYSTYQAVSGSGGAGIEDLKRGYRGEEGVFYPRDIAGNVLAKIDDFLPNGYTKEEIKMIEESKKIFNDPSIGVTATCVRVPVFFGHSVSINVELEEDFDLDELRELYRSYPGIDFTDFDDMDNFPSPLEAKSRDDVLVGRIRRDESLDRGLNIWCVADNVRKGAASNAVQILFKLLEK